VSRSGIQACGAQIPPIIVAVRRFLRLVEEGDPPSDRALAKGLDELALAYYICPDSNPAEDNSDPPEADYKQLYAALCARFPEYGYYAMADPLEVLPEKPSVGDAIDDLADIVLDLREVLWRFETLGADDAHWLFRLMFRPIGARI
jgi:hypothetical protein